MDVSNNGTPVVVVADLSCPHKTMVKVINIEIVTTISALGVLFNVWCVVVFALILIKERPRGHMFKYLLVKAVHDAVQFVIQLYVPLYYCAHCPTYRTYVSQVWYIWLYYYVESVNELCSGFLDLAAAFDCLITINQKLEACRKNLVFYLVATITLIYSALFYIFFIYNFEIAHTESTRAVFDPTLNRTVNVTVNYFDYEYTAFSRTKVNEGFRMAHGLSRDVVVLVAIVGVNLMILATMKRSIRKKKSMLQTAPGKTVPAERDRRQSEMKKKSSPSLRTAKEAEKNITLMILVSGLNYFFGHILSFVNYCFLIHNPSVFRSCMMPFSLMFFYASYMTPFLIYVTFNKVFRSYAFGMRMRSAYEKTITLTARSSIGRTQV